MKIFPEEVSRALGQNLKKTLPYWKRTISKMEACLEKIEALPSYEDLEKTPGKLEFLEQEQAEIFKDIRDAFSNFALAYWTYTDPTTLSNEICINLPETITSDIYKDLFCPFEVEVCTKADWLIVKTPPLPGRYKRYNHFSSRGCYTDYSPLYSRELNAALAKKFAQFSREELTRFWSYPKKNFAYIFAMSKGDSHIIDSDNRDTKTTTDTICDHLLTDDGAYCTSFESFSVSDEILPVGTYIIVSPNFQNPPSLPTLIETIKSVKLG